MEFTISYIAIVAAAAIIGAVAGYVYSQSQKTEAIAPPATNDNSSELESLKRSLAAQFDQQAATAAQIEKSLELVKAQIIDGAQHYADLDVSGHFEQSADASIEPPRDWAPKTTDSVGTLSEEYGLKEDITAK